MAGIKHTTEKALRMLKNLPRVSIANIRDNPNSKQNVIYEIQKLRKFLK